MKKLYTPQQMQALDEFEKRIAEVSAHLDTLKALGITFADREALNADRALSCQRCREICAAHDQQQQG